MLPQHVIEDVNFFPIGTRCSIEQATSFLHTVEIIRKTSYVRTYGAGFTKYSCSRNGCDGSMRFDRNVPPTVTASSPCSCKINKITRSSYNIRIDGHLFVNNIQELRKSIIMWLYHSHNKVTILCASKGPVCTACARSIQTKFPDGSWAAFEYKCHTTQTRKKGLLVRLPTRLSIVTQTQPSSQPSSSNNHNGPDNAANNVPDNTANASAEDDTANNVPDNTANTSAEEEEAGELLCFTCSDRKPSYRIECQCTAPEFVFCNDCLMKIVRSRPQTSDWPIEVQPLVYRNRQSYIKCLCLLQAKRIYPIGTNPEETGIDAPLPFGWLYEVAFNNEVDLERNKTVFDAYTVNLEDGCKFKLTQVLDLQKQTVLRKLQYQLHFRQALANHDAIEEAIEELKSSRDSLSRTVFNQRLQKLKRDKEAAKKEMNTHTKKIGKQDAAFSKYNQLIPAWAKDYTGKNFPYVAAS